jgi:hypothetical protein
MAMKGSAKIYTHLWYAAREAELKPARSGYVEVMGIKLYHERHRHVRVAASCGINRCGAARLITAGSNRGGCPGRRRSS